MGKTSFSQLGICGPLGSVKFIDFGSDLGLFGLDLYAVRVVPTDLLVKF